MLILQQLKSPMLQTIEHRIAAELGVKPAQVIAAVQLLDEGATVPFIARYRKEITGELDDIQLRLLEERLIYLRELEERRATVLASIEEQGKLTAELKAEIVGAETKQRVEDLYLPYKSRRRTKPRSRARPVWSPWPMPCSTIQHSFRRSKPQNMFERTLNRRSSMYRMSRQRSVAHARF